ncbi:NPH3 domain-containing protein [Cinnamomum micranthum f. kanehirae]|uniref:NPH3 domain-containing protein n=1 Tax=Cinnamomum micranthum f. kanehirae TaxID=337451 RepID=A0A443Q2I9_9MAGN|nr:NPH3 domain-containing protein [Cinnamomum micranthum f. kanehirae]
MWRSAKLAKILKQKLKQHEELSCNLTDIPADAKTFELAMKFCYGKKLELSANNIIPLACVSSYLEMTEEHSSDNLIKKAISFFHNKILPSWNESVKALRTCDQRIIHQATHIGLIDHCVNSIIYKACEDPFLLGMPIENPFPEKEDYENQPGPSARRKLFEVDLWVEDLTTLILPLYELVMNAMVQQQDIPPEFVAGSLFRYAKKRADVAMLGLPPIYVNSSPQAQREVIEAVERLLPDKREALHCRYLFEMFHWAIALQASHDCLKGFQVRIGKQLEEAVVEDLFIPCYGYLRETRYDIECVMGILKNFFANYTSPEAAGLIAVSKLVENFLSQIAKDPNLSKDAFATLVEMFAVTADQLGRQADGIYRAIDIYFGAHGELTESEREELCQLLDCHKLSPAALEHAAQNERLPLRVVVQVLFVGQVQLRDAIVGAMPEMDGGSSGEGEGEGEEGEKAGDGEEVRVKEKMQGMESRVMKLETECNKMKEMERGGNVGSGARKKGSLWKELKRKLGCMSTFDECNSHVKKVCPRKGV